MRVDLPAGMHYVSVPAVRVIYAKVENGIADEAECPSPSAAGSATNEATHVKLTPLIPKLTPLESIHRG